MRRAIVRALFAGDGTVLRNKIPLIEFSTLRLSNGWNAETQSKIESANSKRFEGFQQRATVGPRERAFSLCSSAYSTFMRQFHDSRTFLRADEPTTINPLQQTPISSSANKEDVEKMLNFSPSTAGEKCARAVLRGAHIGPRKLNMFAALLRGLHIEDALIQCKVHHKKAARMCEKLLMSAKANAVTNHGLDGSKLKVKEAWVGKGQYLRRISIHGRGRSGIMHKYRSHLTVILKEEETPRRTKIVPMLQERTKWRRQPRQHSTSQAMSG